MVTIGLAIFMQAVMNWAFGNNAARFPNVFQLREDQHRRSQCRDRLPPELRAVARDHGRDFLFFPTGATAWRCGRRPTASEVAQSLGISVKQVFAMLGDLGAGVLRRGCRARARQCGLHSLAIIGIKVFPAVIVGGLIRSWARWSGASSSTAGELGGIHRRPVPARRQHVHGRTVLRAHHHPDDPPLRPVRHRGHQRMVHGTGR